jgi:lipopolysaccharide transport system ATP-binding protein
MSETAIRAEGLGKQYRIGRTQRRYPSLRDAVTQRLAAAVRSLAARARGAERAAEDDLVWALRDVSFRVGAGDVVGIVGGNGAGKSTLLKILARVTEPSVGTAEIHGRVGSLLEVGTGFHPELTGRENTFLNGAILGMRRAEIERKFDEIVAFAEVERFIDTPVKHYSSGMYLRLAFAVAAHLEPEILLVDEVLAVGDVAFQKKCLGKMDDVARGGRTVLFVSHNMDAVQRLCTSAVLLERGRVAVQGDVRSVVSHYLSRGHGQAGPDRWIDLTALSRWGSGEARFTGVRFTSGNGAVAHHPYPGGPLELTLAVHSDAARVVSSLAVTIATQGGTRLIDMDVAARGASVRLQPGRNTIRLRLAAVHLTPGVYVVGLWLGNTFGHEYDYIESAFEVEVVEAAARGLGVSSKSALVPCDFDVLECEAEEATPLPLAR